MRQECPALKGVRTLGGVSRRLVKWAIHRKWGRLHLLSPDPEFDCKRAAIAAILAALARLQTLREGTGDETALHVLFADEFTFYRQPALGPVWHEAGKKQPTAPYQGRANTKRRVIGALDVGSGQVPFQMAYLIGVQRIRLFLRQVREFYGPDCRIVLIWDNWPVHKHPDVLAEAREQRIELLFTPTYAPWCNPIEKYWRKLKRMVLTMHRHSQEWEALVGQVARFLTEHTCPRPDLLREVGLAPRRAPT